MSEIGIRELRQNLSVYVRRVQAGETLGVTERGKLVALLTPLPGREDPLSRLEASGRMRPALRPLSELPPPLEAPGEPPLSELVAQAREDR